MYISKYERYTAFGMYETGPGLPGDWGTPAPRSGGGEPAAPKTRGSGSSGPSWLQTDAVWRVSKKLKASSYGDKSMYCERWSGSDRKRYENYSMQCLVESET
jgi:hypothetical protein